MASYRCSVCGYIYNEEAEGAPFSTLKECPVCHQPTEKFTLYQEEHPAEPAQTREVRLEYPREFVREDASCRYMKEIHQMAVTGKSLHAAMGTRLPMPSWDDILILGAQLDPMPLEEDAPVRTATVIGRHAKRPLVLENPFPGFLLGTIVFSATGGLLELLLNVVINGIPGSRNKACGSTGRVPSGG